MSKKHVQTNRDIKKNPKKNQHDKNLERTTMTTVIHSTALNTVNSSDNLPSNSLGTQHSL